MPWIDKEKCTGCRICVGECPTDTIFMESQKAAIDMSGCIRCGRCHVICPVNAIRHDSEKIPEKVEVNIAKTKEFMDACENYLDGPDEGKKCLARMIKHFKSEKIIAEKTLKELEALKLT